MEFMTVPQQKALNKISRIKASDKAKAKGFFPKRKFKGIDIAKMLKNRNRIKHTMSSLIKSAGVIKAHDTEKIYPTKITAEQFLQLDSFIKSLGMDSWGVCRFTEDEIYKGDSIPYEDVIVLSRHMDDTEFVIEKLPNMDCMLEVMQVYGDTGVAALKVTELLRGIGFGALPNHSLGGNVDYTKAGYKANLGFVGKHGMLITPHSGPCNRLSIIYTSIDNLSEFIDNREDFSWGNSFCEKCKKCVRSCPYDAIYDNARVDENGHIECISNAKCNSGFAKYGCGVCIATCPFTKIGYEDIKKGVCNKSFELII